MLGVLSRGTLARAEQVKTRRLRVPDWRMEISSCQLLSSGLRIARRLWVSLGASHGVHVRVGRAGPHDIGSGIAMGCRHSCCFRVEGPHDHPMRGNGNCQAGLVIWIGIATLSSTREHVCDPWNGVGWPGFMSRKISGPLHRWSVSAHRRLADGTGCWNKAHRSRMWTQRRGFPCRVRSRALPLPRGAAWRTPRRTSRSGPSTGPG